MPYFFHPIEVANEVATYIERTAIDYQLYNAIIVALLHDVIEDTEYTEANLRERFDDSSVDAVVLLSKVPTLDYRTNIQRIIDSNNITSMFVKLADNRVNRRGDKSHMSQERAAKLNARYDMSINMLVDALATHGYHVE